MKLWDTSDKWLIRTSLIFTEKRSATACSFNTCVTTTLKDWQKCFGLHTLGKGYLYVTQWRNLQKEWKEQCSLFDNWTLPLQKQHNLTETKKILVVGQLWEKNTFDWSDGTFRKHFSRLYKQSNSCGWKEQKLLLTFCISDCVLKRWKNVFGEGNFEEIGGKKGLPHRYHWMLTEAYCEFLQCPERVKRLRPKYADHIFSIFISTNGLLILWYLCPQTSNSRYVGYCLRSKLASDLKQE